MTNSMLTWRSANSLEEEATKCTSSVKAATIAPAPSCWMRRVMLTGRVQRAEAGGAKVPLERGTLERKRRVTDRKSDGSVDGALCLEATSVRSELPTAVLNCAALPHVVPAVALR